MTGILIIVLLLAANWPAIRPQHRGKGTGDWYGTGNCLDFVFCDEASYEHATYKSCDKRKAKWGMDVREDSFNTGECSEKGYCHMEEDHEEQCGKGKECIAVDESERGKRNGWTEQMEMDYGPDPAIDLETSGKCSPL